MQIKRSHTLNSYLVFYLFSFFIFFEIPLYLLVPYNIVRYILFIILLVLFICTYLKTFKFNRFLKIALLVVVLFLELFGFYIEIFSSIRMFYRNLNDYFVALPRNFFVAILMCIPFSILYGIAKYNLEFGKQKFSLLNCAKTFVLTIILPIVLPSFLLHARFQTSLVFPNDESFFWFRYITSFIFYALVLVALIIFSKGKIRKAINFSVALTVEIYLEISFFSLVHEKGQISMSNLPLGLLNCFLIEALAIYCMFVSLKWFDQKNTKLNTSIELLADN